MCHLAIASKVKTALFLVLISFIFSTEIFATPAAKTIGNYTIHLNAFSSDTLQPNMAKAYNITRSKNRGLLTISVVKNSISQNGKPVKAQVSAKATNLTGQLKNIKIREIDDGNAVYYLSEFHVADKEVLDFTIEVQPSDKSGPYTVQLRQQFFTQ